MEKKTTKKSIEKEILEERKNRKEEKVEIDVIKKSNTNIFKRKFNDLKVKYKKDPKKSLLFISSLLLALALLCGTSYAYLTYIGKTGNTTLIEAGTLALTFKNESNAIFLNYAIPQKDSDAIENNKEYEFTIKNNGSIAANYIITLDNTCTTSKTYTINDTEITPDKCVPDKYIKVGIKEGNGEYKVVEYNEGSDGYVIDANYIDRDQFKNFKMKIWLDYDTPNDYNSLGKQNIIYSGKLGLTYEQNKVNCNRASVEFDDGANPNPPVLSDNMIPVYYDDCDRTWKKADATNITNEYKWYNYSNQIWANSVTVSTNSNGVRTDLTQAPMGTEIPMDRILTMQVWIPRYKYKVWNYNNDGTVSSGPQEIDIQFERGTATTGEIECTDNIQGTSDGTSIGTEPTTSETCKIKATNATCTDATCKGLAYTHPAFTFGDKELTGFWVGKFEVSSDTNCTPASGSAIGADCNLTTIKPLVKPNVTPWRGAMVGTFENNIMTMNDASNKYGFATTDDTHMIKNMEWGAVAYLSHSKYGINKEIAINSYSSYMTGCGPQASGSTSSGEVCNAYNTTLGKSSSTTGNIYGIYDMSGGADEYVMGNIVSPDGTTMMSGNRANDSYPNQHSGYSGILYYNGTTSAGYGSYTGTYNYPDNKYYDKYSFNTSYSTIGRSKLGDAVIEVYNTSNYGWYSDVSVLSVSGSPWLRRGGHYNDGSDAGVFYSGNYYGSADTNFSSRLVILQTN